MKMPANALAFLLPLLTVLFMSYLIIGQSPVLIRAVEQTSMLMIQDSLKLKAFSVLEAKCNVCYRKQNPFMIFSKNNMNRRANSIYQQVFEKKRMPKGNRISLTSADVTHLKQWLFALNIQ